ncbi:hypothetical protein D7X33_17560 [Butyricicoccus sp. 1XD8-22]|nr:hypothetical protein D7X33_17560 [Butyricicoccus sp. 1XD8-22]
MGGDKWFYGKVQLNLKQGENTITIAGRKSGYVLRQIMLSPQQKTDMSDWLTACEAAEPAADTLSLFSDGPEIELARMDDVEMAAGGIETVGLVLTGDTDISYTVEVTSSDEDIVAVEQSKDNSVKESTRTGLGKRVQKPSPAKGRNFRGQKVKYLKQGKAN